MRVDRYGNHNEMTCSFGTFIVDVSKNIMMARVRKSARFTADSEIKNIISSVPDASEAIEEIELKVLVQESVEMLDAPCSDILTLFYWVEATGKEIAKRLNYKNADSVKTQKLKCMRKLEIIIKREIRNRYGN